MHWDLKMCLNEYYRDKNPPERKNLEFLSGLRNKIEHRELPQLDTIVYGECQSALMNLEDYLIREFGTQFALSDSLAVSLQFSRIRPSEKLQSMKSLAREARTVLNYIETFKAGLSDQILNDLGYSFRAFLIPKTTNNEKSADAAVEFVRLEDLDSEQRDKLQQLTVLIKEKHVPISNLNLQRPAEVVNHVAEKIPFVFKIHHHTKAWKFFEVRPSRSCSKPENTKEKYCVYDRAHNDYLYTEAWTKKLRAELSELENFYRITGQSPRKK